MFIKYFGNTRLLSDKVAMPSDAVQFAGRKKSRKYFYALVCISFSKQDTGVQDTSVNIAYCGSQGEKITGNISMRSFASVSAPATKHMKHAADFFSQHKFTEMCITPCKWAILHMAQQILSAATHLHVHVYSYTCSHVHMQMLICRCTIMHLGQTETHVG